MAEWMNDSQWAAKAITARLVEVSQTAGRILTAGEWRDGRAVTPESVDHLERVGSEAVTELDRRGVLAPLTWVERPGVDQYGRSLAWVEAIGRQAREALAEYAQRAAAGEYDGLTVR